MTEYIAQCRYNRSDTIKAHVEDKVVWLEPGDDNVALSPADARTFARGILALADEVDGGEAEKAPGTVNEPSVRGIKAGDKVRVLVDGAEWASVSVGDVFTVHRVGGGAVVVHDPEDDGFWYFREPESLEKVVDEPVSQTETQPSKPARAALLDAATDLMHDSSTYTAHDLIALADYLAEEK